MEEKKNYVCVSSNGISDILYLPYKAEFALALWQYSQFPFQNITAETFTTLWCTLFEFWGSVAYTRITALYVDRNSRTYVC